jgi:hypothetical protein
MTNKKASRKLMKNIRKATGINFVVAANIAKAAIGNDFFSDRLKQVSGDHLRFIGGGGLAPCGCCDNLPAVILIGPRGQFTLRDAGR